MVASVFKLLVYAVVAVAVLWAFFYYLLPYFLPPSTTIKDIDESLMIAETRDGEFITKQISFLKGETLSAGAFDTPIRSVTYQCYSGRECCSESAVTDTCEVAVQSRNLSFIKDGDIEMNFRCELEHNIHDCKIYLGGKPPQLEFSEITIPKTANISEKLPEMDVTVKNVGDQPVFNVLLTVRIYNLSPSGSRELYTVPIENYMDVLNKDAEGSFNVQIPIQVAGDYEIEAIVTGDEAGKDIKLGTLTVDGTYVNPNCVTTIIDEPYLQGDLCISRHRCNGCDYSVECKFAWKNQGVQGLEFKDREYAVLKTQAQDGSCD